MTLFSLLAKRAGAISSVFYSSHPRLQNPTPLLRLALSTQTQTQPQAQKELPFIAQYLISSFGFSPHRALKVSAHSNLAPIKSPERPEAVVKFLSDTGLTDAQIKAAVSLKPYILCGNVDKIFKPKLRELINGGSSRELLVMLIRYNPHVLYLNGTPSRLRFWIDFFGKDEEALFQIIPRNPMLFTLDIDKHILPKINLLKEYGVSNPDVLLLLQQGTRCLLCNLDSLRGTLDQIEELGIPTASTKFFRALKAVAGISGDTIKKKVEYFKKIYGWSQEDVNLAFAKFPKVLTYSEGNVKLKMDFLIRKAGFEPRSLASNPMVIGLSLERVLIPRYTVLHALAEKGVNKKCSLLSACKMSERNFYERYVVPFEKDLPGLGQAYLAAKGLMG